MKKYMIIGAVLAVAAVLIAFFFFRGGKKPVYRTLRLDRGDVVAPS
jgi:flagellar biosynthesis/type III secretory pathway M-ring protein FliF/YscJ